MHKHVDLIDALRDVTAVAVGEIDASACLVDSNAGFLRLLPQSREPTRGRGVLPFFLSPTYDRLIELVASSTGGGYSGLLTLGEPVGKTHSLRGSVFAHRAGPLLAP